MSGAPPVRFALKLFASLVDYLPPEARRARQIVLEMPAGTTVADVIGRQQLPPNMCHLVLVNGVFIPPAERAGRALATNDELAIWPPIAGG